MWFPVVLTALRPRGAEARGDHRLRQDSPEVRDEI